MPAGVIKQLQRREVPVLGADAGPCALALSSWLRALLELDEMKDEVAVQREKQTASKLMDALCRCVCDILNRLYNHGEANRLTHTRTQVLV